MKFTRIDWVVFYASYAVISFARSVTALVMLGFFAWLALTWMICCTSGWIDVYSAMLRSTFLCWNFIARLYGAPVVDVRGIFGR